MYYFLVGGTFSSCGGNSLWYHFGAANESMLQSSRKAAVYQNSGSVTFSRPFYKVVDIDLEVCLRLQSWGY